MNKANHGFDCSCLTGFLRTPDPIQGLISCEDVNECKLETDPCPGASEQCRNTLGSFECDCVIGFYRSNETMECEDIDECGHTCLMKNEKCENKIGSFECTCVDGFQRTLPSEQCTDIDECATNSLDQFCANDYEICQNLIGSFDCLCSSGFERNGGLCYDIDECSSTCRGPLDSCSNVPGTYDCNCINGYVRSDTTSECADVDECDVGTFDCETQPNVFCVNFIGSYTCGK